MSTNFQLKRLKLNLDIVEKPENRVHKLTNSNVSLYAWPGYSLLARTYAIHAIEQTGRARITLGPTSKNMKNRAGARRARVVCSTT